MHMTRITISSSTTIHGCPDFHQVESKPSAGYSGVLKFLLVTKMSGIIVPDSSVPAAPSIAVTNSVVVSSLPS